MLFKYEPLLPYEVPNRGGSGSQQNEKIEYDVEG
jgi:hypothetical protein